MLRYQKNEKKSLEIWTKCVHLSNFIKIDPLIWADVKQADTIPNKTSLGIPKWETYAKKKKSTYIFWPITTLHYVYAKPTKINNT